MNVRILYFIAAVLAFVAAGLFYFRAEPGEDVMLRVILLAVGGLAMLALGFAKKTPRREN